MDRGARATKAEDGKGVDPAKSVDAPAEKKVRATTGEGGGDDVGGVQDGGEGGAGVAGEGDGSAFGGDGRDVVAAPAAGSGSSSTSAEGRLLQPACLQGRHVHFCVAVHVEG